MFKLPSGKKIDEERVINAMENGDISNSHFLDTKTGEVNSISKKYDSKRFLKIPKIPSKQMYKWMKEYIKEFIGHEDPEFTKRLNSVLKVKKPFKLLEDLLENSEKGWIHGWKQWKQDYVYEEMTEWLMNLPLNIKDEWEFSDDCASCQAMKKASEANRELTLKELESAFEKAKKNGAVVGIERSITNSLVN